MNITEERIRLSVREGRVFVASMRVACAELLRDISKHATGQNRRLEINQALPKILNAFNPEVKRSSADEAGMTFILKHYEAQYQIPLRTALHGARDTTQLAKVLENIHQITAVVER